jgi:ABC-type nitrate/sulfonate/bicarbonate transport system permease component
MLAPIALSTAAGIRGVSRERISAARTLGASRAQVVRHVMLPSVQSWRMPCQPLAEKRNLQSLQVL